MRPWYEELFSNYAARYDNEPFTRGTAGEVDFLEAEIGRHRPTRILDVGCGTGRHAIELARRGYDVTAVDLSPAMLRRARDKARDAGVQVTFLQADARHLPFDGAFDLAIMLCEGAFPLMETDAMNYQILQSVARALTGKGTFIFTTLNGLFPLARAARESADRPGGERQTAVFDPLTLRERSTFEFLDDDGTPCSVQADERYYVPSEITWLLHSLGFATVGIHGCTLGAFSRNDPLTSDDFEMLVVARRTPPRE